jgi:hypothetical protein
LTRHSRRAATDRESFRATVRESFRDAYSHHPRAPDTPLVIEVADSSIADSSAQAASRGDLLTPPHVPHVTLAADEILG